MSSNIKIVVHPGKTVARELSFLGMTQNMLAERAGVSGKLISDIINGKAMISPALAASFENIIGGSASFWLTLCANYQALLAREEEEIKAKKEAEQLNGSIKNTYEQLRMVGEVPENRQSYKKILVLQRFFSVDSLLDLPKFQKVAFRKGRDESKIDSYALAAWLKYGDKKAREYDDVAEYNRDKLINSIPQIKEIIYRLDEGFFTQIQDLLASCGVVLISVTYFKNTYTNGATRWMGGHPVIQLSDRGKTEDIVWFTLFHEIGHILKHGKTEGFVSTDGIDNTDKELEADRFATETLLPAAKYDEFKERHRGTIDESEILSFCASERIRAAILIGRLQHDNIIAFNKFTKLKIKIAAI